jgi:Tol biopolymer transport system component
MLPDANPLEPLVPILEGLSTLALSPDGSLLVFVGRKGATTQLFVRRLSEFTVRPIDGTDGAYSPFFSPSGDAIAFFAGTELRRVSLADQRVSTIRQSMFDPWGGVWAPDGRIIVARQRATELIVINASGDSLSGIRCSATCSYPELLPDGQHVIASSSAGLGILTLADGSARPLRRYGDASDAGPTRGSMARLDGDGHLVWVAPNGDILAAPFDAANASFTGPPVAIGDGVRVESGRGAAQFAVARSGLIAFAPGPLMSVGILVRADRTGKLDTIPVPPADYNGLDVSPDGRRVLAMIRTPNGENVVSVIDVSSGQATPWLTSPSTDRLRAMWDADGQHAYAVRGKVVMRGDPTVATPPETLRMEGSTFFQPLPDGKSYFVNRGDTVVVQRNDGSGEVTRVVTVQGSSGAVTADGRWELMQETVGGSTAVVARALDGSGRRLVIPRSEKLGMVWAAHGTNEFIMGGDPPDSRNASANGATQTFWSLRYDPAATDPFSTPTLLFASRVADFPGRNYSVDRSARSFVFKQHLTAPPPHEIRVIQQWHAALTTGHGDRPR